MLVLAVLLVLHKVLALIHLAHVVVQGAHPSQHIVGTNFTACLLRQLGHHHGVTVGTGGLCLQGLQHGVAGVPQLHQPEGGGRIQQGLQRSQEAQSQDAGDKAVEGNHQQGEDHVTERGQKDNLEGEHEHHVQHANQQGAEHHVDASGNVPHYPSGGQAGGQHEEGGNDVLLMGVQHSQGQDEGEDDTVGLAEHHRHQQHEEGARKDDGQVVGLVEGLDKAADTSQPMGGHKEHRQQNGLLQGDGRSAEDGIEQEEGHGGQQHQKEHTVREGLVVDVLRGGGKLLQLCQTHLRHGKPLADNLLPLLHGNGMGGIGRQAHIRDDGPVRNLPHLEFGGAVGHNRLCGGDDKKEMRTQARKAPRNTKRIP